MDKPKTKNSNAYLEAKVLTASPEQLQLMLYDGAIRFCEQARLAIQKNKIEESFNLITKAEKIVLEMLNSLRDEFAPDTCANMRRLYVFCYDRLIEANLKKIPKPLDEALDILRPMRETWILLIDKLKEEKTNPLPSTPDPKSDDPLLGTTVSLEG
ncbi:MAG: flagellar export chaperone FliS [Planctomycetes bacterium]|nr:flagellar export chaperone FliS [Planctomycetota bacterium]